jgi:carboxypeptidase family protein
MLRKLAGAALLLVMLLGYGLFAQDEDANTRSVQGIVTDAAGSPVAGASVKLKDTKTLQVRSFITQTDGSYHFAGLSPNVEYELQADYQGASSPKKTVSVFNSQKTVTINLKLKK